MKSGDIIYLNALTSYVVSRTGEFLEHHGTLNQTITDTIPCGKGTATKPTANWTYTVRECKDDIEEICENFINNNNYDSSAPSWNKKHIIYGSRVVEFIERCYYVLERIYGYKFSYYTSTSYSSLVTKEYLGLRSQYSTSFDNYKTEFLGYKTKCSECVNDITEKENVSYGGVTKSVGKIIYFNNIKTLCDNLEEFNKYKEKGETWGNRNYIHSYYETRYGNPDPYPIDDGSAYKRRKGYDSLGYKPRISVTYYRPGDSYWWQFYNELKTVWEDDEPLKYYSELYMHNSGRGNEQHTFANTYSIKKERLEPQNTPKSNYWIHENLH